jgi:hypothetical protein
MSDGPLIVVHQMAKVGSLAWVEAARPLAARGGAAPLHTHYLTAANMEAIEAIVSMSGAANTIVHPLVGREVARRGRKATGPIEAARAAGETIWVITGMRDPVARSISLVSFLADFCGHAGGELSAREGASAEAVCAFLAELWRSVLAGTEPAGSFERLAWRVMGAYRTWFDEELAAVFGLDIFAAPFPPGGGAQRMRGPGVELLAYRAEDMAADAPARRALQMAAETFLGTPDVALPQLNTAATRRSFPLYLQTRERFALPAAALDAIYDAPAVRHFYSPAEIAAFKARWIEDGSRR